MLNLIFLTLAFWSVNCHALTPDEIRDEIHARMNERHPEASAGFWASLGPDALPVIKEMYRTSTSPIEQSWLIDGLSHFSDPSVADTLQSAIKSSDNDVFKKKMLSALIRSQGDASFDFVEPYLQDKDVHVRLAVASGMQQNMQGPRVQSRLAQYKKDEPEAWAKDELSKAAVATDSHAKRAGSVFQAPEKETLVKPLSEKQWAGEWKGIFLTPDRNSRATAYLTSLDKGWKVELKLPKLSKYELKREQLEMTYYQTAHAHWIEVRNKKDDSVFIAQKKATP